MAKGYSKSYLDRLKLMGYYAIQNRYATGFIYYPQSIERQFSETVQIPISFSHRSAPFLLGLERSVSKEFKNLAVAHRIPTKVMYYWLRSYPFQKANEQMELYDIERRVNIKTREEYRLSSGKLLAEGSEQTIVIVPHRSSLIDVVNFLLETGSFYAVDEKGNLIPTQKGARYPYRVSRQRLNDEAYRTPMLITSYHPDISSQLPAFAPVKKLFKTRGNEEICVFVDKKEKEFVKNCRIRFEGKSKKLANKVFRDYINFEAIV